MFSFMVLTSHNHFSTLSRQFVQYCCCVFSVLPFCNTKT
uniref:Uncharacterized protein n=1 Tax=Anguilla anguilla TaxID=7936 RepID=A0A0E9W8U9_ANGAN